MFGQQVRNDLVSLFSLFLLRILSVFFDIFFPNFKELRHVRYFIHHSGGKGWDAHAPVSTKNRPYMDKKNLLGFQFILKNFALSMRRDLLEWMHLSNNSVA